MNDSTHVPSKRDRVIALLLERPRVHRFDIERLARDHVPNTTISNLKRAGLEIHSRIVELPGFGGSVARVAEYALDEGSRPLALEMLQRRRRGKHVVAP